MLGWFVRQRDRCEPMWVSEKTKECKVLMVKVPGQYGHRFREGQGAEESQHPSMCARQILSPPALIHQKWRLKALLFTHTSLTLQSFPDLAGLSSVVGDPGWAKRPYTLVHVSGKKWLEHFLWCQQVCHSPYAKSCLLDTLRGLALLPPHPMKMIAQAWWKQFSFMWLSTLTAECVLPSCFQWICFLLISVCVSCLYSYTQEGTAKTRSSCGIGRGAGVFSKPARALNPHNIIWGCPSSKHW